MTTATQQLEILTQDIQFRGPYFAGNSAADTAEEWLDLFGDAFDPRQAINAWMDAGFWDAWIAKAVSDRGFSPDQIMTISKQQADAGISYASGDLIYALCNGDAGLTDIDARVTIGEWGYGDGDGGHIVCYPRDVDAVRAAYDAIDDGDLAEDVLAAVEAAGGEYVEH